MPATNVGAGLLAINDNAVFQVNRGDAIASKPAPTKDRVRLRTWSQQPLQQPL